MVRSTFRTKDVGLRNSALVLHFDQRSHLRIRAMALGHTKELPTDNAEFCRLSHFE